MMDLTPAGAGVVWLASYPKSGNTWMRFLLTHLIRGGINTSADVDAFIPEAAVVPGLRLMLPKDQTVLLKTHWEMNARIPLMRETLGFVCLVRNPLDVMISLFHFNQLRLCKTGLSPDQLKASQRRYIEAFIDFRGNPLTGDGGGNASWIEHAESWLRAGQSYPCVFVRYEDLLENPVREISHVLSFLNLKKNRKETEHIINKCSYAAMKKMEEREIKKRLPGFFYHEALAIAHRHGSRFMRSGRSGDGRKYLAPDQLARFVSAFGGTMGKLGYQLNPGTGAVRIEKQPVCEVMPLPRFPEFGSATITQG